MLWKRLGTTIFWVCWPAGRLYMRIGTRSRILVISGEQVLVVKSWIGTDIWSLPGGGVHRGEQAISAARRELLEETGIVLPAEPTFLFKDQYKRHGLRFAYDCYAAEIPEPLVTKKRWPEITEAVWLNKVEINPMNAGPDVCDAIAAFYGVEKQQ